MLDITVMTFSGTGTLHWLGFEGEAVRYDFIRSFDRDEITGTLFADMALLLRARATKKPVFLQLSTGANVPINFDRMSHDRAEVTVWEL